ncbi:MAG: UbiD family decarboxylase [Bacteroidales bacterium]|nr:UbiD family decarboxylase [Candidatus Cacconaster merdequi]
MYRGLKSYVSDLKKNGELTQISEFTDPVLDIARATVTQMLKDEGSKALLFEETGTPYPVLTNMSGPGKRMLSALGADSIESIGERIEALFQTLFEESTRFSGKIRRSKAASELSSLLPKQAKGHAPCQDSIQYKTQLSSLPLLKNCPQDAGRCITKPLICTVGPLDGKRNLETGLLQFIDDATTGIIFQTDAIVTSHLKECTHRLPVAVCLGGDPIYSFLSAIPLPEGIDKFAVAGLLRGAPVELVDCMTQKVRVPADCDFVLEGYIQKSEPFTTQGPFENIGGLPFAQSSCPKFHLTCITHRSDAVFPAEVPVFSTQGEHFETAAAERLFLKAVKLATIPQIADIVLPCGRDMAIVKIDKHFEGQAFSVANALWGTRMLSLNKFLVIVDSDTDIRSFESVTQAIAANYLPSRDTLFGRGLVGASKGKRNPGIMGGKLCIDATSHTGGNSGVFHKETSGKEAVKRFDEVVKILFDEQEEASPLAHRLQKLCANCDIPYGSPAGNPCASLSENLCNSHDVIIEGECLILDARTR